MTEEKQKIKKRKSYVPVFYLFQYQPGSKLFYSSKLRTYATIIVHVMSYGYIIFTIHNKLVNPTLKINYINVGT